MKRITKDKKGTNGTREYREYAKSRIEYLLKISRLDERDKEALEIAISALDNKTPCSLCRFVDDDSDLCDMCPAMPLERGAE